jgi:hypothetical protein
VATLKDYLAVTLRPPNEVLAEGVGTGRGAEPKPSDTHKTSSAKRPVRQGEEAEVKLYPFYLGNEPQEPNHDLEVEDKYTGEVAFRVAKAGAADIARWVSLSRVPITMTGPSYIDMVIRTI